MGFIKHLKYYFKYLIINILWQTILFFQKKYSISTFDIKKNVFLQRQKERKKSR